MPTKTSGFTAKVYLEPFDYQGVRLLDGMLKAQYDRTRDYYYAIPNDDILKGFRERAGLPAPGQAMGGWAQDSTAGVFGQWLSGMARMHKATGDKEILAKALRLMTEWGKTVGADGKMLLVDPDHPPTMRELMSHTAGFTYGFFGDSPVDKMYRDANLLGSSNLQDFIDKISKLPLLYQPGQGWTYSMSMDIEGYIVEKLSGKSLPDFMRGNIYAPLGMRDAGFFVPPDKRDRFTTLYRTGPDGALLADISASRRSGDYDVQPTMPSGGGGMVSTAEDYYRFATMLLNGGELDGKRILSPSTVRLMTSNHVPAELLTGKYGIGAQVMRPGFGYGYNGAVIFDPPEANLPDGKGEYFWDGAAGTWFWVDPANDVVFIGMIQRMLGPASPNLEYESRSVIYGALVDPAK